MHWPVIEVNKMEYDPSEWLCDLCSEPVGTFGPVCNCRPLEILVFDQLGNVVEWSGPIGCLDIRGVEK